MLRLITLLLFSLYHVASFGIDWQWSQPLLGYQSYSDDDVNVSGLSIGGDLSVQKNRESLQRFQFYYFSGEDKEGKIRAKANNLGFQYSINYPKIINKKTILWYGYGGGTSLSNQSNVIKVDNNNNFVQNIGSKSVIDLNITINASIRYRINHGMSAEALSYLGRSTKGLVNGFYFGLGFLL